MATNLSDRIRSLAREKYVNPAKQSGKANFIITVRDLLKDFQAEGLPGGLTPQICSALQTGKFLLENGLEIEEVKGPPSKKSPTVVVRYRFAEARQSAGSNKTPDHQNAKVEEESPEERARRLTEKLRGLLKEELAEYGGAEGFIRWVRGYDEEDAA